MFTIFHVASLPLTPGVTRPETKTLSSKNPSLLSSSSLSIDSGVRIELIRNAIKSHAKMTVPLYINSFQGRIRL